MSITEIKQRLSISEVLSHYGLIPDKNCMLHCPFHDDKTPSMQVYHKTNTVYCFSANCKTHAKSLDVIDFIMYKENSSKREAILRAKELITGQTHHSQAHKLTTSPTHKLPKSPTPPTPESTSLTHIAILTKIFTYFKNAVYSSSPARDYLQQRGLDSALLASVGSSVGYNSGQFHHGARRDEYLIKSCEQVGLLSPFGTNSRSGGQAYKPFAKGCICFALKNRNGQISGLYFRSTTNDKKQRHFYLKDRQGLYPKYPSVTTKQLIITESIIDAASLLQLEAINKQYSILALYGTNTLTEEHIEAISGLKDLREVIFFLNGDDAGRKATTKHAETLKALHPQLTLSTVNVPEGEDVNSLLQSHVNESGQAQPEIFTHLLEARTPLDRLEGLSFSTEKTTEKETPKPREEQQTNQLNTTYPYKITWTGKAARYAILGGISKALDSMKITLQAQHPETNHKSRNKVDLYEDNQVERLCKKVSEKLDLRKDQLEEDLYRLTDLLDEYREQQATGNKEEQPEITPLTTKEREELEAFARQPKLIWRLGELLGKTGIVGEEHNRIFLFLIAFSHKLPETLHALIQGSSGSGKTRLMRQVSDCMPKENVDRFTRISDKALYNFPETYFVNHLLCLEDMDGLSEDAEYSARELISGGELRSAVSIKNENGQITEGQKIVKGPVASLSCTTKGEIYEDNMSRVFLIAVDESPEQTQRIIGYQNNKSAGILNRKSEEQTRAFLQRFTRFLMPYEVINPYAGKITLPKEAHKIRRLNELFQGFIKIITVVNQHQRSRASTGNHMLIAEIEDIETAIEIMFESIVLKVDELDGSLRNFYERLKSYIQKQDREFTQREVRQALQVSKTQLQRYMYSLLELEYIERRGNGLHGATRYRVVYWDNNQALRKELKESLYGQLAALK